VEKILSAPFRARFCCLLCYTCPMNSVFEERYARLNAKQKEAVDTIDGPVMVIAGPGTGKTTILTLRIANILRSTDTPPSGILAITFTEAGVKAMRAKLREVIGSRADEVRIHTFHGFAGSIIREFPDHFAHISDARQLTDIEAEASIRDILKDKRFATLRPFGNPDLYVGAILKTISDAKKEAWTPAMIQSHAQDEAKRIAADPDSISTRGETKGKLKADAQKRIEKCQKTELFADVYEAYEARKKENKAIDYDDLILEVVLALGRDELLLRLVQERFLYILVDEHQDTNDSQNLLVRMVADFFESPNLFVVGDEKQAIYRFQGASVENFLSLQNAWPDARLISLSDNYRSHQGILDASFALIENNYAEGEHESLRVKLVSGTQEKKAVSTQKIDVVMAGNVAAMEKYLGDELKKIEKESDMTAAVIVRTNRDVGRVLDALALQGVRASAERGADIFAHPVGATFFDLAGFLADQSRTDLFARTLAAGLWNISLEASVKLIADLRAGITGDLEKQVPALAELSRARMRAGAIEFMILAATRAGLVDRATRDPLSAEVWRGLVSLAQDVAGRDGIDDPRQLLEALLSYKASSEGKTIKVFAGSADAQMLVMTAHGSKGLEYDYVFIPYAIEESWMPRSRASYFVLPRERGEGDDIKDARRLFYVALTRARKHVSIIAPLTDAVGRELSPLRFISELDPSSITGVDVPAAEPILAASSLEVRQSADATERVHHAIRTLSERGLSVTALNHFMRCPHDFYIKSILRVPEAPNANSEKGNAMHEAMARVWKLSDKSEKTISAEIIDAVQSYFRTSLLPVFEKEALLEELIAHAPAVAKALLGHLSAPQGALTEKWFEADFEGLRLHGKLDAVVEDGDTIRVFDYKTREALSVAAIKGETVSSDGAYFRQLVYYHMLISQNPSYKGKRIEASLVFLKPDGKGRCQIVTVPVIPEDVARVKDEIRELVKAVNAGAILQNIGCAESDCVGCRLIAL